MIESIKWQGKMCLKSSKEAIHFEVYSVKTLNKKNMSSQFLLDEQAKKEAWKWQIEECWAGKCLFYLAFYVLLLNYGSPWHHNLLCLHRTKNRKTLCNQQKKKDVLMDPSRGLWLLNKQKLMPSMIHFRLFP